MRSLYLDALDSIVEQTWAKSLLQLDTILSGIILKFYPPDVVIFTVESRTFAQTFSNNDFFLKILPLEADELVMSEM